MQALAVYGPIVVTLFSNVPKKVMYPLFYLAFLGVTGAVLLEVLVRNEVLVVGGYEFLPEEPGMHGVDFRHYENQRPAGEVFPRIPSIQSDIIRDPFVKLFIPYVPRRHNAALPARCPGLRPLHEGGFRLGRRDEQMDEAAMMAVLECLAALHQVTLNGDPLHDPQLQFYTHPQTGLRGVILYIPTEGLPRGRNLLAVQQAPRAEERDGAGSDGARPDDPYIIPFWL